MGVAGEGRRHTRTGGQRRGSTVACRGSRRGRRTDFGEVAFDFVLDPDDLVVVHGGVDANLWYPEVGSYSRKYNGVRVGIGR